MTDKDEGLVLGAPATYRVQVQGLLDESYSDRLGGMTITTIHEENEAPVTTLEGRLLDQAALAGVLDYLYTLRLPILSVDCLALG
jgi:hypothetical protein